MRVWILVAGLMVAGPAVAGETPQQVDFYRVMGILTEVSLAGQCKMRSQKWVIQLVGKITDVAKDKALADPANVIGSKNTDLIPSFMLGATLGAFHAGMAEYRKYGPQACVALTENGDLPMLDALAPGK